MSSLSIEHINITVSDPERTAKLMETLFGWRIRWRGPALDNGETIHVGSDDHYLALYSHPDAVGVAEGFAKGAPLNHIGIIVDDLDEAEASVLEAGLTAYNHANYDPGRRFYFMDQDRIEYELISYA